MKIRALEIENFRKFARPMRVGGFADGINVLFGPQEFGKSTILAAVRGLLFERYRSRVEEVRRMQTLGSSTSPVLAMEFDLSDGRYRIEKRFLHREPYARLLLPDGQRIEGDPAEEELQRLLGFAEPGRQGSSGETVGIWGALWVPTRASFTQPEMLEGTRRTFQECLDSEVGALAGGARGQNLLKAAREELAKHIDGNGKPRGRYKEALADIAALRDEHLPKLKARQQGLVEDLDALAKADAELRRETATDEDQQDRAAIAEAQSKRDAAMQLAAQIVAADSEVALGQARLRHVEAERAARQTRAEAIRVANAGVKAKTESQTEAESRAAETAAEMAQMRQRVEDAEGQQRQAERGVQTLRDALEAARLNEELVGLEDALRRARAAQTRLNTLAGQFDAIRIDQKSLNAIQKAARARSDVGARLQALATRVTLQIEPAAAVRVSIDGRPLPQPNYQLSAVDEARIAIEGIGSIAIRPMIRDRDALDRELETAERTLGRLLRAAGAADVDEAQSKWTERQRLAGDIEIAKAEMHAHAPGKPGLEPGPDALASHVERQRAMLTARLLDLALPQAPIRDDVETQLRRVEADAKDAASRVEGARRELAPAEGLLKSRQEALAQAQLELRSAMAERDRLQREQTAAIAAEDDAGLEQRCAAAMQSLDASISRREELRRQETGETVEILEARIERLQAKIEQRRGRRDDLRSKIQGARIRIAAQEGDGIGERLAQRERELAQREEEAGFFDREVRVLRLLIDELSAAEREAKERYMAPVVKRIQPYLQLLLPGATVQCDEDFTITGVLRDSARQESFDRLSDGTQEQIAVLTRLAFATLLVDRGKPAAVILDDALAHSDPERMERMFDILTHAARKTQILILSCDERQYDGLGGHRLTIGEAGDSDVGSQRREIGKESGKIGV